MAVANPPWILADWCKESGLEGGKLLFSSPTLVVDSARIDA